MELKMKINELQESTRQSSSPDTQTRDKDIVTPTTMTPVRIVGFQGTSPQVDQSYSCSALNYRFPHTDWSGHRKTSEPILPLTRLSMAQVKQVQERINAENREREKRMVI